MNVRKIQEQVLAILQEMTSLYMELSENLSENCLHVVTDNSRGNSEVKKMPWGRYFSFPA